MRKVSHLPPASIISELAKTAPPLVTLVPFTRIVAPVRTPASSPVTNDTTWDYTKPNTIPYVVEWSNSADAEMGLVQTQSWEDNEAGGDYGGPAIKDSWGKTGGKLLTTIANWQWPYQLNQYEIPFVNSSHRLAWGASFGAVGQSSYQGIPEEPERLKKKRTVSSLSKAFGSARTMGFVRVPVTCK